MRTLSIVLGLVFATSIAAADKLSDFKDAQQITAKKNAYDNCRDWRP